MLGQLSMPRFLLAWVLVALACAAVPAGAAERPEIDAGFHLLYELKFREARTQFAAWEKAHPDDPLGAASEAASYLFEEFYRQGILTSEFFLDDKRLLGGIKGKANPERSAAFDRANRRAQELARRRLQSNPKDADAWLALTISTGMQADYTSLIEKRQLASVRLIKEAEGYAKKLLEVAPDSADAYLALGAANYIIGSLPAHKRFFLSFGGIHGDKKGGIEQLSIAAKRGHYLRPFAKLLLGLAALREKQLVMARTQLRQLVEEFPDNPLFAQELAKLNKTVAAANPRP
ncbi:MAG TPA: hypothetical protein VKE24_01720 [Candidatus Acidoferrales bacterium]|nr:hypothetical protein [Candidatus Acidoferrales bacterium]